MDRGDDLWEHRGEGGGCARVFLRGLAEDKARMRQLTGYPPI